MKERDEKRKAKGDVHCPSPNTSATNGKSVQKLIKPQAALIVAGAFSALGKSSSKEGSEESYSHGSFSQSESSAGPVSPAALKLICGISGCTFLGRVTQERSNWQDD